MRRRLGLMLALAALSLTANAGEAKVEGEAGLSFVWEADAKYPVVGNEAIDKRLRTWLEEHINAMVSDAAVVAVDPDFDGERWSINVTHETARPSPRVVSVVFATYAGSNRAAHPMTYYDVLNFDADLGKELTLGDLFLNPEAALEIMAQNAPRLVKRQLGDLRPDVFPDGADDDVFFMEGFEPKAENYSALALEPNGVRVIFQKYQILPYVFGNMDVYFPLSLLEPAGPNHVWWGKEEIAGRRVLRRLY